MNRSYVGIKLFVWQTCKFCRYILFVLLNEIVQVKSDGK